jgi:pyruvate dehydrogenase E1 component alpha subunit
MYTYKSETAKTIHKKFQGSNKLKLELYESMLLIRRVQEQIARDYHKDEMKTPVHLCIGEEAIAAGVCKALDKQDLVFSNHRGHGHYLAKGGDLKKMMAELFCKETGCSKGRGGSMHLIDRVVGIAGSSSIVAGGVPLATGAAFAQNMRKEKNISVVFFGDAASEEGVVYESMNFAALKKLPILYICTNNFYAVCSPIRQRTARQIYRIAEPFNIPTTVIDGTDVEKVYAVTVEAVKMIRRGQGPVFIEMKAYRWLGHSGGKEDHSMGYRSEAELECWKKECPVTKYEKKLYRGKLLNATSELKMEDGIKKKITTAFAYARKSPLPKGEDLLKYVYQD